MLEKICETWFKISVFLWVIVISLGFIAHFTTDEKNDYVAHGG